MNQGSISLTRIVKPAHLEFLGIVHLCMRDWSHVVQVGCDLI